VASINRVLVHATPTGRRASPGGRQVTTSAVLGLVGGVLILVGLIGGGFSFSGTVMPTVGKAVRIPCFIVGSILVVYAIFLALVEGTSGVPTGQDGGASTSATPSPRHGTVQGGNPYVYRFPSLSAPKIGVLTNGADVTIQCTTQGDMVTVGTLSSSLWDRIGEGYLPDVVVYTGTDQAVMPTCTG